VFWLIEPRTKAWGRRSIERGVASCVAGRGALRMISMEIWYGVRGRGWKGEMALTHARLTYMPSVPIILNDAYLA